MTTQATGTLAVDGLSMYYERHGAGPPLALLHGAFGTIESCFANLIPLLAKNREVLAFELQGHGRTSDIDRPLTYEALAGDVVSALSQLGYESADIVGYSLGGGVAIEIAMRYPAMARRVVFAGGPAFSRDGLHPEIAEAFTESSGQQPDVDALQGSVWHQAYLDVAPDPDGWPSLIDKINEFDRNFTGWTESQLRSVIAPVMLVAGDADLVSLGHVVESFKLFGGGRPGDFVPMPASQLAILPGTNHVGVLDRVDWLHTMIDKFLKAGDEEQ